MPFLPLRLLTGRNARDVRDALHDTNPKCERPTINDVLSEQDIKRCLDLNSDGTIDGRDFRQLPPPAWGTIHYEIVSDADRLLKKAHIASPFDALRRNWHFNRDLLKCWDNYDPTRHLCAMRTLSAFKMFTDPELWHDPEFLDYAGDLNPLLKLFTPDCLHKNAVSADELVATRNVNKLQELYARGQPLPDPPSCFALFNDVHNLNPAMTRLELLDSIEVGGDLYWLSHQWTELGSWKPTVRDYAYNRLVAMYRFFGFPEIPMTYGAMMTFCHDAGIDHPERLEFGFILKTLFNRRLPISQNRPVWLIIFPKEDAKGSFLSSRHMLTTLVAQRRDLDIRYYEAGSVQEIERILEEVTNHGEWWIQTLWLGAHASDKHMSWGYATQPGVDQLRPEDLKPGTRLHDLMRTVSSRVLLEGCWTGAGGEGAANMVNAFAVAVEDGVKVTGPRAAAPLVQVCLSDSGEINRTVWGNNVTSYTVSK